MSYKSPLTPPERQASLPLGRPKSSDRKNAERITLHPHSTQPLYNERYKKTKKNRAAFGHPPGFKSANRRIHSAAHSHKCVSRPRKINREQYMLPVHDDCNRDSRPLFSRTQVRQNRLFSLRIDASRYKGLPEKNP